MAEVTGQVTDEVRPVAEEPEGSVWVREDGFLPELALVCDGLTALGEEHMLPASIRQIVDSIENARTVEDFAQYDNEQLQNFTRQLRDTIPRIEREVIQFVSQMGRARSVAVASDVDFI